MLPGSGCVAWMMGCMVKSPDRKGDDHGTAAARDVGPGRPRRAGTPLPHHPRRHHPHPLPDAAAARRRPSGPRGRPADLLQPRHGPPGPQALPGWWARRGAAPAPPGAAAPLPARLGARDGAGRVAPGGVCVQAAPLGAVPQGAGPAGVGKKRLRVEALLAAAASPVPPPAHTLIPDATLADELFPEDLPRLLGLLGHADLYLQDEV